MPPAAWTKLIYETVDVEEPDVLLNEQCESLCLLDDRPCFLWVAEYPSCHLGDWNIDSTTVTSTQSLSVWGYKGEHRVLRVYIINQLPKLKINHIPKLKIYQLPKLKINQLP